MLIKNVKERERILAARNKPCLNFTPYPLNELVAQVRKECFPDLTCNVNAFFIKYKTLACIIPYKEGSKADIFMHHILNRNETPREVLEYIFKHELLHLVVPPREVKGRMRDHPPEFWEQEQKLVPVGAKERVWKWIHCNYWECLKNKPRAESTEVLPSWKEIWGKPLWSMEQCCLIAKQYKSKIHEL